MRLGLILCAFGRHAWTVDENERERFGEAAGSQCARCRAARPGKRPSGDEAYAPDVKRAAQSRLRATLPGGPFPYVVSGHGSQIGHCGQSVHLERTRPCQETK